MILSFIEQYQPLFSKRRLQHSFTQTRTRTQRHISRTERKVLAAARRQYYVTNAIGDMRTAAARNEDIVIASLLITVAVSFSLISTATNVILAFMQAAIALSDMSGLSIALLVFAAAGVLAVLSSWAFVFLLNMLAIAVMEGATRKQHRSIRVTIRKGLSGANRVTNAWFSLIVLTLGPTLLGSFIALIVLKIADIPPSDSLLYLIALGTIAVFWILSRLAHYSLAPYVALFEPTLSLRQSFERSRQLVRNRGRWFMVAGYLAFWAALAAAYGASLLIEFVLHIDSVLPFIGLALVIVLLCNGAMTMFYRKRKLARI